MTESVLLDSSALIALALTRHEHHKSVSRWLGSGNFVTCPLTEGALLRTAARAPEGSVGGAMAYLRAVADSDRCTFWPDDVSYRDVAMTGVYGHKQVTDAYLAQLARTHNTRLATLDRAMAQLHDDVAVLVPTS